MLKLLLHTFLLLSVFVYPAIGQYHPVPPSPEPLTVVLPDGSSIKIIGRGSDFVHWAETLDGYTVQENAQGYYEYAIRKGSQMVLSGIRAFDPEQRSLQQMRQILGIPKHLSPENTSAPSAHTHSFAPLGSNSTELQAAVPSKGKLRLLAICIEYPDLPHSLSADYMRRMLNEGVDGKPSFRDYFLENSYGQLDMQVDVAGWVKASKNYRYYGDENGTTRARELVQEALQLADDAVDYRQYDNDKDGDVDGIIIIHSGPGAEEGSKREYIWSHRWTLPFASHDNTFIFDYAINPETRSDFYGGDVGIGIFCHEFGHLLGLPDLYDTDSNNGSSNGIGEWGLMGSGGWLGREDYPAGLSAWSKERLGWVQPRNISNQYGTFILRPSHGYPDYLRIETGRSGEYFLLENRQQAGYDVALKGEGLAVWHINSDKTSLYPSRNSVNAEENLKGVDLEEADGRKDLDNSQNRGDDGDLFPGSSNIGTFNFSSNPGSESYTTLNNSRETGISLENIEMEEDGLLRFTHNRLFSNSGEDCNRALIAFEGLNEVEGAPNWYEFTMPREGSLWVDTRDAGQATHGQLYLNCSEQSFLKEAVSYNDQRGYQTLEVKNLPAGQKVLLRWKPIGGEPNESFSFVLRVENQVAAEDSLALVAMYNQLEGPKWQKKQNWLQTPVSGWEGVRVENGRVVSLEMIAAGLKGKLPDALFQLTALRTLRLQDNQLSGTISEKITSLQNLEILHLQESALEAVFLNKLSSLQRLKELSIQGMRASSGLPADLGQLKQLELLSIVNAELPGAIPVSVGDAVNLRVLNLVGNRLNGALPAELGKVLKLVTIRADNNLLSGRLPAEIVALPSLQRISLEDNLLTALPDNLFSSNSLNFINLSRNRISGGLSQVISRTSTEAIHLDLSENLLAGNLNELLANLEFSLLDLSHNLLEGEVPALKVTSFLGLTDNQLSDIAILPDLNDSKLILQAAQNQFTFEDLVPNADYLRCASCTNQAERYSPQDTLREAETLLIRETETATYTLPYDATLSTNRYQWYKDGKPVSGQTGRILNLSSFSSQQAGEYSCQVTNSLLPGLTLLIDDIQIELKPKQEQQISISEIAPKSYGGSDFELQATSSSGLPISYSRISGPVSLNSNKVSITGAGEAVIKANQAGNPDFLPVEKEIRFTIAKAEQNITTAPVASKIFGDTKFSLSADASSGLPVILTLVKGNIELEDKQVTILGAGEVEIRASQPGNDNYKEASPVVILFEVAKASQSISWNEIPDQVYGAEVLNLTASSSVGLPVSYEILEGPVVQEGQSLRITGAGNVTLRATQLGNANYAAAIPVERSFVVAKASQQISFAEIPDQEASTAPLLLEAQSDVGLPVAYRVVEGAARLESGNQLFLEEEGQVTIEAYQTGNENYLEAVAVRRSFNVTMPEKLLQSINVSLLPDTVEATEVLLLQWSVSSNLEPDVDIEGPAILQGNELIFTASGNVRVRFQQTGNDEFQPALPVIREFFVAKAAQAISFDIPAEVSLSDKSLQLEAISSSGLPVEYRVLDGAVSLQGNTLDLLDSGDVIIEAIQPGNELYQAAEPVIISFEVFIPELLSQSILFQEIADQTYSEEPLMLDISASSGLPLTIIATGPVNLQGKELSLQGVGQVTIQVYQKGNDAYAGSDTVTLSFEISPAPQTISFSTENVSENIYALQAAASSGLPVSFEIISGEANLEGNTLIITGIEDVEVKASQAGDSRYLAAVPVSITLINNRITTVAAEQEQTTKAYPNPSFGKFYLEHSLSNKAELSLYDSRGQLLNYWSTKDMAPFLDLSNQAAGVYQLVIRTPEGVSILRLVKK